MNISTQTFQYVLEISKCGSISRAAQNLFLSQPNLSTAIRVLEETLGYQIFQRSPKGIIPTPEGALFIKSAEIIVAELDNIRRIPELCRDSEEQGLSVVCVYAPFILELFMQYINHGTLRCSDNSFKETGLNHALQDMIAKTYRLGFFYDFEINHHKRIQLAEKYHLEIELLHKDIPVMAYVKLGHPLSERHSIDVSELNRYPIITYEDFAYEDWLGAIGIEKGPHNILYIYDRGGMKESIRRNDHIGISVGNLLEHDMDILQIPISGMRSPLNQYTVRSKEYRLNSTERGLIAHIKTSLKRML